MATAKQVKAGKDYPHINVKKGEMHWVWEHYGEPTHRANINNPPRPSQLISGHWSEVLGLQESIADFNNGATDAADAGSIIEDGISTLEDVQGRYDEIQEGPRADVSAECSSKLGELIDGLQNIRDQLEELENGDEPEEGETPELYHQRVIRGVEAVRRSLAITTFTLPEGG